MILGLEVIISYNWEWGEFEFERRGYWSRKNYQKKF